MAHVNIKKSEMEVHHRNTVLKLCGTCGGSDISHKKSGFDGKVQGRYWYTLGLGMVNVTAITLQ